jgi:K+-sensing histidine kinase KdpD
MSLNENNRLSNLADYHILDTANSSLFDNLTKLAAQISSCPIAIVSLVDKNRTWCKSSYGTSLKEVDNQSSICKHLVKSPELYLEVLNFDNDERFVDNPLIQNKSIQYYLGFPLIDKSGARLGAFCILDSNLHSQPLSEEIKTQLHIIATQVMALIEHHKLTVENKMSQQRLLEASRASIVNEMTRSIAHEINNPLTVLKTSIEILGQLKPNDPNFKNLLGKMNTNVSAIHKVVLAMKDNNVVNNNQFCSLDDSIKTSFEIVSKKFATQKVVFNIENSILFNSYKVSNSLQQVIFHLLQNAAFASLKNPNKNPEVSLRINKVNEYLILNIEDSGLGVPEDKVPALFSGLFHSNYKGESVGIGLNTCKRIIESIGGSIRFVKNSPTTFEVGIPLKLN